MIVCDTNVLISAFLFPGGTPDKIFRAILSRCLSHATSPDILTELRRVFWVKFKLKEERLEELINLVIHSSQLVYPTERLKVIQTDDADNRVLECAVTAKADYLVTGDRKHLLVLKSYKKIIIISPRYFAEKMALI